MNIIGLSWEQNRTCYANRENFSDINNKWLKIIGNMALVEERKCKQACRELENIGLRILTVFWFEEIQNSLV